MLIYGLNIKKIKRNSMDACAYLIAYNVIYNRIKGQEQTLELIVVKETKL